MPSDTTSGICESTDSSGRGAEPVDIRLQFTIAEHGAEPANGERFMEGFMAVIPEGGPSISQNLETGSLTITFALEAGDAKEALDRGLEVFADGAARTGLEPTAVLDLEASVVRWQEPEAVPELQPA